jgi:hypothetical protein
MKQLDMFEELEKKKKKERLEKAMENYAMSIDLQKYTDKNGNFRYKVVEVPSPSFKKYYYADFNAT